MLARGNYRFLIGGLLIAGSLVFSYVLIARATSLDDVVYPVAELSGCKNETECRAFCDKPDNITSCVNFAEKHNLMSKEEAEIARKFSAIGGNGPGGCTGQDSCEAYCNDIDNINECLSFAEKNGLMEPEELEEAKKVQVALAQGVKLPGGCKNKESCEVYCENPDNMRECLVFAEAAGFIPPDELVDAKKALAAIEKGIKPPPCRGREDCDTYCSEPGNFEQCISFAEAAGFVSAEDAQMARKTGGKGPGDCRGREECEKFCEDEANGDICFNFAKDHGLISEEELKNAEEGRGKIQEILNDVPPEVAGCLSGELGDDTLQKLKDGSARPSHKIGDSIRQCFETLIRSGSFGEGIHPPGSGPMPQGTFPSDFSGPGGCKGEAECKAFCEANPGQCGQPNGNGKHGKPGGDYRGNQPPTGGTFPQGLHPDGSGERGMPTPEQLRQQYEQESQRQSQQQYQEKYNEEFQRQYQEQQQFQQQQQPTQPPSDGIQPPVPQPQSNRRSFLGSILNVLTDILY